MQRNDHLIISHKSRSRLERLIGDTPLLDLSRHSPDAENVRIFAKAEFRNPGGSIKDRAALSIVRRALAQGDLRPGRRLLDASSGNTGLAYAMLGAAFGFGVTLWMPENASPLQKALLQAYGAQVHFTDALEGIDGAILAAREVLEKSPEKYYYANQYDNPANWQAHYVATAPEIWRQTHGEVTHFVAGLGTSGTFVGTGRRLRELAPGIRLVSVQPDSLFHGIEGLKHMASALVPRIYDPALADENMAIATEEAIETTRRLAREDGLLVGLSSGAALAAARRVADSLQQATIVTIFPDAGHRYVQEAFWKETSHANLA